MREGYRVVTTIYRYVRDPEEAYNLAKNGRAEGNRTEIITEDEYMKTMTNRFPMQDLLLWRRRNILGLPH